MFFSLSIFCILSSQLYLFSAHCTQINDTHIITASFKCILLECNSFLLRLFVERDGDELEGMLVRKNEWENTTKKASNRLDE